jgi:demethylmenaquinone methyltransferase / 2-methoxy-6-polyprenyl-1,4-benzoquinol methylase
MWTACGGAAPRAPSPTSRSGPTRASLISAAAPPTWRWRSGARVDFSHAMLQIASRKTTEKQIQVLEGDALRLPFPARSFDLVVSSFGFRNLANYDAGLREIYRVLRDGGEVGILDFSEPRGFMGGMYRFYFRSVLPRVGAFLSGVEGPYAYLPASVAKFPSPAAMLRRLETAGFREASWTPYTFGIAGLFRGKK